MFKKYDVVYNIIINGGKFIMIVYEATKQLFVEDVVQDKIEENIDR